MTGPDVVETVPTKSSTSTAGVAASVHGSISGVAHFAEDDEAACLDRIRRLLAFLPSNNWDDPPLRPRMIRRIEWTRRSTRSS